MGQNVDFSLWLEATEHNLAFWQKLLSGLLNLDPRKGMGVSLGSIDAQGLVHKLEGLAEFAALPSDQKERAMQAIFSPAPGTVGDLARAIAD